tara:strand:+ start:140 stop:331 length:192 start_codon:yes stop_codon:yes gene_type:complete
MTRDDFFQDNIVADITRGKLIDLAFIDGIYLSNFAYLDLINTIKYCDSNSGVVLDGIIRLAWK